MSEWICPACGGGFPELKDDVACPWCEFSLDEAVDLRQAGEFDVAGAFPSE